ncbi:MAG TPA: hypothetical protein VFV38_18795 [Ktedonobacteraceae bacterium]|nr:hypothetical protein [Ktedonobacteraceae bacterium]
MLGQLWRKRARNQLNQIAMRINQQRSIGSVIAFEQAGLGKRTQQMIEKVFPLPVLAAASRFCLRQAKGKKRVASGLHVLNVPVCIQEPLQAALEPAACAVPHRPDRAGRAPGEDARALPDRRHSDSEQSGRDHMPTRYASTSHAWAARAVCWCTVWKSGAAENSRPG